MKKIVVFSVELQDLSDFSFFAGAKEFQAKYREYEREYSYYAFDLGRDVWRQAEKDLQASALSYQKSYSLELDDQEIADHPVHYLTIPALNDLVTGNQQEPKISADVAGMPLAQDFNSEKLVVRGEILDELSRLNPAIKAGHDRVFDIRKKKYRMLADPPQLEEPMLIGHGRAVKENEGESRGTYYVDGWDGRSSLSEKGIEFVKGAHLVAARLFQFQERQYRQNAPNYLISGEFASYLRKKFKGLQITPMTFDLV